MVYCATSTRTHRVQAGIVLLLLLLVHALPASAVEVLEVKWGFDGKVVPERMNILSVLVLNTSRETYDSDISLHRTDGLGAQLGANLVQPCFLGPFASRWIQFYPYVGQESQTWTLTIGKQPQKLPKPRLGAPAVVCLQDPDAGLAGPAGVQVFPDNLFPPTVAATDGLSSVILDHAPSWEPARREAFLDWLRRGGTVHLAYGEGGEYPRFSGELSVLNEAAPRFRVGMGPVRRHEAFRHELTDKVLAAQGFPAPALREGNRFYHLKLADGVFRRLKVAVDPHYNWVIIYAVLVLYVGVIGPVNYIVGRRSRRFSLPLLLFLAAVLGFAVTLSVMGRRGYGESRAIHTISYARPVSEDMYDVTQWTNVFVLRGDDYSITHPGSHNLYSTCQDYETVNGAIRSGVGGVFTVDIPLYSSRPFLHRGKMKGHRLDVQVVQCQTSGDLTTLELSTGPDFPQNVLEMWALHGDTFYKLARKDGHIGIATRRGTNMSEFLAGASAGVYDPYGGSFHHLYGEPTEQEPEELWRGLIRPLILRSIGGTEDSRYSFSVKPPAKDCVQLFILAESPEGFKLVGQGLGQETGYVVYHLDLFEPEKEGG